MEETVIAKGKIFELVQVCQPDGRVFEIARRAPGVRVIIADHANKKVLLTKERRRELNNEFDYRLPGGKVFDTLEAFEGFRKSGQDMQQAAAAQAQTEAAEEAGIYINDVRFYKKSVLGTTVEWDLYVFEATTWQPHQNGQQFGSPEEHGTGVEWYTFAQAQNMIMQGAMQEERVALLLLQWIKAHE